jgi:5-formyltetrahydrofolate cyclo-ligase
MKHAKKTARRKILALRDAAHDPKTDAAMIQTLMALDAYQKAKALACYVSYGSEVDTHPLITRALSDGKTVAVPHCVMKTHEMKMLTLSHFPDDLHPGTMGILEPDPAVSPELAPDAIDLIVVPGVGFTKRGERLGYGGGFYDRYLLKLKATAHLVALVPEFLLFDALPTEAHDLRIPTLITEKRIIDCSQFIE